MSQGEEVRRSPGLLCLLAFLCSCPNPDDVSYSPPQVVSQTLPALHKLLSNVLASPLEPKFRSLRLANATIQKNIVSVSGKRCSILQSNSVCCACA